MKAEQARKRIEQSVEALADALEHGDSEAMTLYLAALSRFHRYSFGNVMLIASQRPNATRVAGFRTWKKLGRYVNKGEKGIVIIAPMVCRNTREDARSVDPDSHPDDKTFIRFKAVHVFDLAQTDGDPLPEPPAVNGEPGAFAEKLRGFVAESGIELVFSDGLGNADGMSEGGKIALRLGLSPAAEFNVLVHELAHEMLHRDRENLPSKTVRETEAEAVAFVVTNAIGLDTTTAASDYIRLYRGNRETLSESLDRIQRAASAILEAISLAA